MRTLVTAVMMPWLAFPLFAQQIDFDHYTPSRSVGLLPDDFKVTTLEKIAEDMDSTVAEDASKKQQKDLVIQTHVYIDNLLHSGNVLFGDRLSNYVSGIMDILLKHDPELRNELRIYTVRSADVNAFTTRQGIVFVTTGLISQMENEAQLASVLAHEVQHYVHQDVVNSYLNQMDERGNLKLEYRRMSKNEQIKSLSAYSRDLETRADEDGFQLYLKSGYDPMEALTALNILAYSHLPFQEVEWRLDYLNGGGFSVPHHFYPDSIIPIEAYEDDDDTYHSHPNIKSRIEKLEALMMDIPEAAGEGTRQLSDQDFQEMRDVARFDLVYHLMIERRATEAIYAIYLLEEKYPNSTFLKRMKAYCWYLNGKEIIHGSKYNVYTKKMQGQSSMLHGLLSNMNKKRMTALCLNQVLSSHEDGFDPEFTEPLAQNLLNSIECERVFDLEDLSQFIPEELPELRDTTMVDTSMMKTIEVTLGESDDDAKSDSTLFSMNPARYELVSKIWPDKCAKEEEDDDIPTSAEITLKRMYPPKFKVKYTPQNLGIQNVVVVDPVFLNLSDFSSKAMLNQEEKKDGLSSSLDGYCQELNMNATVLDSKQLSDSSVRTFNRLATLDDWYSEFSYGEDEWDMILYTDDRVMAMSEETGANHFLFPGFFSVRPDREFKTWHLFGLYPFVLPFVIADLVIPDIYTFTIAPLIDIHQKKMVYLYLDRVKLADRWKLHQRMYDMLHQISSVK